MAHFSVTVGLNPGKRLKITQIPLTFNPLHPPHVSLHLFLQRYTSAPYAWMIFLCIPKNEYQWTYLFFIWKPITNLNENNFHLKWDRYNWQCIGYIFVWLSETADHTSMKHSFSRSRIAVEFKKTTPSAIFVNLHIKINYQNQN